jgi:hypothetical protein
LGGSGWPVFEGFSAYPNDTGSRDSEVDLTEPHRAPAIVYCASVSPNLRCVSAIVRQTAASVSANVRRKWPSIARRAVHYCASLHLSPFARRKAPEGRSPRRSGLPTVHAGAKAGGNPNSRPSNKPRFSPYLTQAASPLMSPDSFAFTAPQSVVLPALRDYEPPLGTLCSRVGRFSTYEVTGPG